MGGEDGCDGSLGTYSNCLVDTDDGKQKNKNHDDFPWTENKEFFCFTSSLSSTRSFDWNFGRHKYPGQISVNSFGQGKCTIDFQSGNIKNCASGNHVSTASCTLRIENWSPSTWLVTVVCGHFTLAYAWEFVSHACTISCQVWLYTTSTNSLMAIVHLNNKYFLLQLPALFYLLFSRQHLFILQH